MLSPVAFTPPPTPTSVGSPSTHFCWKLSRPQVYNAVKSRSRGIEPATFRLVAKALPRAPFSLNRQFFIPSILDKINMIVASRNTHTSTRTQKKTQPNAILSVTNGMWTGVRLNRRPHGIFSIVTTNIFNMIIIDFIKFSKISLERIGC